MIKANGTLELSDTAVCIGNFDGVHLAHAELIKETVKKSGVSKSVVYTFFPHPNEVFGKKVEKITAERDKDDLIEALGADVLYKRNCDRNFLGMSAENFAKSVLKDELGARHVFVGYDFTFGRASEGNAEVLSVLGEKYGFSVTVLPELKIGSQAVKSTSVRRLIKEGNIKKANEMLGRAHFYSGTVEKCKMFGRTLGFPTANIYPDEGLVLPPYGVYAVRAEVDGTFYAGVANVGVNPTVESGNRAKIETNIFGFDKTIYGESIKIHFYEMIRAEKKFADANALALQMKIDAQAAKKIIDKTNDIW